MNCSFEELVDIQLWLGVEDAPLRQTPVSLQRLWVTCMIAAGSVDPKYLDPLALACLEMARPSTRVVHSGIAKDQDHSILWGHFQRLPNRWENITQQRQQRSTMQADKNDYNETLTHGTSNSSAEGPQIAAFMAPSCGAAIRGPSGQNPGPSLVSLKTL